MGSYDCAIAFGLPSGEMLALDRLEFAETVGWQNAIPCLGGWDVLAKVVLVAQHWEQGQASVCLASG
jgi:hypothetical protein